MCGIWTEVFEDAVLWVNASVCKRIKTACYKHFLGNSYWNNLDIVSGSIKNRLFVYMEYFSHLG